MKLVDATYDADEWQLVPRSLEGQEDPLRQAIDKIEREHHAGNFGISAYSVLSRLLSAAPIHPSICDHVEDKWINVDDRLPGHSGEVLVYPYPSDYSTTAFLFQGQWHYSEYEYYIGNINIPAHGITHWMEMPLPPKEKP